tara:strand:- start:462 stop:689 length:228 start_codon:yes stop_codon:yes gene_type:complete
MKFILKFCCYNILEDIMDQILNPFDKIDPLSTYQKFQKIITNIKDKNELLEIGELLEQALKELKIKDSNKLNKFI